MTADKAIFKMLERVLKNQLLVIWMAQTGATHKCWEDECVNYATKTIDLLEEVTEDNDTQV